MLFHHIYFAGRTIVLFISHRVSTHRSFVIRHTDYAPTASNRRLNPFTITKTMPTPSNNPPPELPRSRSSTCPDDLHSASATLSWQPEEDGLEEMHLDGESPEPVSAPPDTESSSTMMDEDVDVDSRSNTVSPRPESRNGDDPTRQGTLSHHADGPSQSGGSKPMETDDDAPSVRREHIADAATSRRPALYDIVSPVSIESDKIDDGSQTNTRIHEEQFAAPSMGYNDSNARIIPTLGSSFLRPGSRFQGIQKSERQKYKVEVEIQYVDLRESFLCGYLKIQGLTEENPTLTTYFEGEIIGNRYSFLTEDPSWGANRKIDFSHWSKFAEFRQLFQSIKHLTRKNAMPRVSPHQLANEKIIFMRWKEHFLVPDHRVRTINGASFEGFYYICFNQEIGKVEGIYFHCKSEKFQNLTLHHVHDGPEDPSEGAIRFRTSSFPAMEFR